MENKCVYCGKELLLPSEKRRLDCDDCHYAINPTYHEEDLNQDLLHSNNQF